MLAVIGAVVLHLVFLIFAVMQWFNVVSSRMRFERGHIVDTRKARPTAVRKFVGVLVLWLAVGLWVHL